MIPELDMIPIIKIRDDDKIDKGAEIILFLCGPID